MGNLKFWGIAIVESTLTKVPNLESQSSTKIRSFFSVMLAWTLETLMSEIVISFDTLLPMWKAGFTEKTITWIAFERHSISDSRTIYFLFLGYLKLSRYVFFEVSEALILSTSLYCQCVTYSKQEDLCTIRKLTLPSNMNILHQASMILFLSPA